MFKEKKPIKTEGDEEWQQEERLRNFFLEIIK
jgi:hypothetical protein